MDEEELLRVEALLPCAECDAVQDAQALAKEVRRLREALRWCIREGGWRLFYHASTDPPAGVFDERDTFNVTLVGDDR